MNALHINKQLPPQSVQTTEDLVLKREADIANKASFLSQLAENDGSEGAHIAKDIITQNPMFMAGTGISSLGYTFLLFQVFSNLEISLLESGLKQTALNNSMYEQLKAIEFEAANDIWLSGLAKGISQITGAVGQLGISAYSARAQNNVLKKNEAVVTGTPTPTPATTQADRAQVGGTIQSGAPLSINERRNLAANAAERRKREVNQPAGGSNNHAPQNDGSVSKEKQAKMNSIAEKYVLLGRAFHDMAIGAGSVGGAWYDADAKKLEGIKHLIQMVIENTNTSKQRAQQQYEEAAKQIEAAIQAYNAAANASH